MPEIVIYMNCDTRLAINLRAFNLGKNDEFIFAIKNYDYIDSPYAFLFRARVSDMDENGEVIFKIPPEASKRLKPNAFYNFSVLVDAFDTKKETIYKKLTDNGRILIQYGAHDLMIEPSLEELQSSVSGMRLELIDEVATVPNYSYEVLDARLEPLDEVSSVSPEIQEILKAHLLTLK
jgi:hypothetical protein